MSHPLQASSGAPTGTTLTLDTERPNRLFIFDSGWHIAVKATSIREFCTTMAPGQDFYHSLLANEIYVHQGTEKLCMACAIRRGIVHFEAKKLRDALVVPHEESKESPLEVDLGGSETGPAGR